MNQKAWKYIIVLFCVLCGCSDMGITPSSQTKPNNDQKLAQLSGTPSPNFPTYRWWDYYTKNSGTKLYASYSPDGLTWMGETNVFDVYPYALEYMKTVFWNNQIYMLYTNNNNYDSNFYLRYSNDGLNWTAEQYLTELNATNFINDRLLPGKPELAVINGELFAYFLCREMDSWNIILRTFKYDDNSSSFNLMSTIDMNGYNLNMTYPSFAELNGVYYLFYVKGSVLVNTYSTDGINWSTDNPSMYTLTDVNGRSLDAVTFNGKIYISFKKSNNVINLIKYDGLYVNLIGLSWGSASGNTPMTTDGTKLIISAKEANNNNYVFYTYDGLYWYRKKAFSSSNTNIYKEIVATYN